MRKFIGVLVVAAAMLRCGQLQAQVTNTNTSASLSALQSSLVSGANVILLQFNATLTTTNRRWRWSRTSPSTAPV